MAASYYLDWLFNDWNQHVRRHEFWQEHIDMGRAGLVDRARFWLFETRFDSEFSDSVSRTITQLSKDCCFLQTLPYIGIGNEGPDSKVCVLLDQIVKVISSCGYGTVYFRRPHKLLSVLGDCQRKIEELFEAREIKEALEQFPNPNVAYYVHDKYSWSYFVELARKNLLSIKDVVVDSCLNERVCVLYDELGLIQEYCANGRNEGVSFEDFKDHNLSTQVASVAMKIAHQAFSIWINRNDAETTRIKVAKLVDLKHQIDPTTNTELMKLFLSFQVALIRSRRFPVYYLDHFCNYLIAFHSDKAQDLCQELKSLVTAFIPSALQDHSSRKDVSSLFTEIEAVIGKVAFFIRDVCQENDADRYNTHSELLTKVQLLKMELFIKEQLSKSTYATSSTADDQFVDKILEKLRGFTKDLSQQKDTEYGGQYLILAEELNGELESLQGSLQYEKITNFLVKHTFRQLLYKIVFFKSDTFLAELLNKGQRDDCLIACAKDEIKSLQEELTDFKRLITSQLMWTTPEEEIIFMHVEEAARKITLFSYSILPNDDKEIFLSLSQPLDKVKHIRAKIREISPPFLFSNFPKTCKVGIIDFLCRNIRELWKSDHECIAPVKCQLEEVQFHLKSLRSFLMKVSDSEVENGDLNDLGNRIGDTTHKLEHVVEAIEIDSHSKYSFWLHNLMEEIRFLNQQVSTIPEISYAVKFGNSPRVSGEIKSKDTTSAINEMMVDLVDEQEAITNQLMRGSSQRDVLSIVGMPGIGKTTLARKVYNNQNIMFHFPRRAWCTVSQVYSKRELLLDLLSDLHGITDEIQGMTDEDLQSKLRRCLLRNKYLIVLDDVWDTAAWNELKISFPDDGNGSRILITTRLRDVHWEIKPGSDPHLMRLLSNEESWMLLDKKIFKGVGCPTELLLVGKQIAEHCQGLPLAVVAIAGVLRKTEKTWDSWEKISKSLSSQVINDQDPENRCKEILELSYKHLPEHLKPCFLYLGVFLEDKEILVSKLTQFWMAEGFIQETESKSLEDVAQEFLMELINRSLVIISKTRSNGKVKTCQLHDLLRDLCHSKAEKENFFHRVTRCDEPYASFPTSDYYMEVHNEQTQDPVTFESYRLSIFLRRDHFIDSRPSGPRTRSLIFFASVDKEPRYPYDISFICNNFKLLRVLDFECINMGVSFPAEIGLMVHLRYLAVSGYVRSIPPSIAKLWKLQTLIVRGFRGAIILPNSIWSMASLRYLQVNEHVSFNFEDDDEQVGTSFHLDNLVSFSTLSLYHVDNAINILRRLPNLLKLRCIFLQSWDFSKGCNQFPILELLTRLESLKIIHHVGAINSGEFILPFSLKKLTLSKFQLPWSHVSRIGGLPNLIVLKLISGAFEGPKWEMNEEEFMKLEFLKLDDLNIAEWKASYDHLPNLKRLVLRNCKDLEEIPQEFAYITTLEMIEVQWCGKSVEESAQKIGEETEEIKVTIT